MKHLVGLVPLALSSLAVADKPSVEILGMPISKGMTEAEVRSALPMISCLDPLPSQPDRVSCSVSDGVPPGADGGVLFDNGVVVQATRNLFFPEDATPYEVSLMVSEVIARITSEVSFACAKIKVTPEVREGSGVTPGYTELTFPEKSLTFVIHSMHERHVHLVESLRLNPPSLDVASASAACR